MKKSNLATHSKISVFETDDTRKIVLEQVTGRWSYNRRPAVFGVYIIYEYGKNLEDVWVYINQNIF